MSKKMAVITLICICLTGTLGLVCAEGATTDKPGLIGAQYGSLEFERVQNVVPMSGLEIKATDDYDFGKTSPMIGRGRDWVVIYIGKKKRKNRRQSPNILNKSSKYRLSFR